MKKSISIMLSMLLVLVLMNSVAFADVTSEATIVFTEGELEIDDSIYGDMFNMDINFGSHQLPTSAVTYRAADGDHRFRVSDGRAVAGNWNVTVALTEFTNTAPSGDTFDGTITLADGEAQSALGSNTPETDFRLGGGGTLEITSGDSDILVIEANPDLIRDSFDAVWTQNNVTLHLDATNAAKVVMTKNEADLDYMYAADMIWTLNLD